VTQPGLLVRVSDAYLAQPPLSRRADFHANSAQPIADWGWTRGVHTPTNMHRQSQPLTYMQELRSNLLAYAAVSYESAAGRPSHQGGRPSLPS
jgi:hypothetical protein